MRFFNSKRRLLLIGIDFAIAVCVYLFTIFLILISGDLVGSLEAYLISFSIGTASVFAVRFISSVYTNVWRYANSKAFISLVVSDAVACAISLLIFQIPAISDIGGWRMVAFIDRKSVV